MVKNADSGHLGSFLTTFPHLQPHPGAGRQRSQREGEPGAAAEAACELKPPPLARHPVLQARYSLRFRISQKCPGTGALELRPITPQVVGAGA